MEILLDQDIDEDRIVPKRPIQVSFSSTFVVDITKLAHPDDVKRDAYGRWICTGSHTDVYKCCLDVDQTCIEKVAVGATGPNIYSLRRLHFIHPSHSEFRRILAFVYGELSRPEIRGG